MKPAPQQFAPNEQLTIDLYQREALKSRVPAGSQVRTSFYILMSRKPAGQDWTSRIIHFCSARTQYGTTFVFCAGRAFIAWSFAKRTPNAAASTASHPASVTIAIRPFEWEETAVDIK
jgi:hypothetical protein